MAEACQNQVIQRAKRYLSKEEPTGDSVIYKKLKVSKSDSEKLANTVEIASGHYEEKEFVVFTEDDPISTDGRNRWQEGIDKWLENQIDSKFHPPTEVSEGRTDEVIVNIMEPQDGRRFDDHDVSIRVEAFSLGSIKKLTLYIDDEEYESYSKDSFNEVINLDDGVYEIKVRGEDDRGKSTEGKVTIGVFEDVDK